MSDTRTHTHTHTHLLSPRGVGPACHHGAKAPQLMDVDLHPEVMDVGVTAGGAPSVEGDGVVVDIGWYSVQVR